MLIMAAVSTVASPAACVAPRPCTAVQRCGRSLVRSRAAVTPGGGSGAAPPPSSGPNGGSVSTPPGQVLTPAGLR